MTQSEIDAARGRIATVLKEYYQEHWHPDDTRSELVALDTLCEAAKPAEDLAGRRVLMKYNLGEAVVRRELAQRYMAEFQDGLAIECLRDDFDLLPDAQEDEQREP
jgi:hypothetical protein